jgi:hypothetical protein
VKTRMQKLQSRNLECRSGCNGILLTSLTILAIAAVGLLFVSVWGGMIISAPFSSPVIWTVAGLLVLGLVVGVVGGAVTDFLMVSIKRCANFIKVNSPVLVRIQHAISRRSLASASAIVIIALVGVGYCYGTTHLGKQSKNFAGNSAGRE